MKVLGDNKQNVSFYFFIICIAAAYIWGVVSTQHYMPSGDGYISIICTAIAAIGGFVFFIKNGIKRFSTSVILWLAFSLLLFLQKTINNVIYVDATFMVACGMLFLAGIAATVSGFDDNQKKQAVIIMAWAILFSGVFTVFAQLVQLMKWQWFFKFLVFENNDNRLIGNIAQPNIAAYVTTLAMASVTYLLKNQKQSNKVTWLLSMLCMFWLGLGVGFSSSRGGVFLSAAAILSAAIFYKGSVKDRVIVPILFAPIVVVAYKVSTYYMNLLMKTDMSAVGRLVGEDSLHLRENLINQAWLAFKDSPITGQGWAGLTNFGLHHTEDLQYFMISGHAHNAFMQIAADLGVLGLILVAGFGVVLIKYLRFNLPAHLAFAYSILMLTGMYSLSEYPLWFMRFLLLAVFFIAIIEKPRFELPKRINLKPVFLTGFLVVGLASTFYAHQYSYYATAAYSVYGNDTPEQKEANIKALPSIFGYQSYKDLLVFTYMPIQEDNAQAQAELGWRVLSKYINNPLLFKQAELLALIGQDDEAYKMFKRSCYYGYYKGLEDHNCDRAIKGLKENAKTRPEIYKKHYDSFMAWYAKTEGKRFVE